MRTFRDAIDAHAAAQPEAPCIVAPERDAILTYGELQRSGATLGTYLAQAGIAPGAVVSFMLPNGIAAASVFLGAMYAGYVVSPVNLIAQDAHLAACVVLDEIEQFQLTAAAERFTTPPSMADEHIGARIHQGLHLHSSPIASGQAHPVLELAPSSLNRRPTLEPE